MFPGLPALVPAVMVADGAAHADMGKSSEARKIITQILLFIYQPPNNRPLSIFWYARPLQVLFII
jgi:hypothetical protein